MADGDWICQIMSDLVKLKKRGWMGKKFEVRWTGHKRGVVILCWRTVVFWISKMLELLCGSNNSPRFEVVRTATCMAGEHHF